MVGQGTGLAGENAFLYWKGNDNYELGTGIFMHKAIIPAV
jgi:hypothetical protein